MMEPIRFKKPSCPLECHHIARYKGQQSLFIKHMLQLKEDTFKSNDPFQFFGCRLCLDCAYKLFLHSKSLKLLEPLCLRPKPCCLYIVSQIISHPQIYNFIKQNKAAFTSFFRLTVATMYSLMNCPIKGDLLILYETILKVLLSLCVKRKHLRWILRLKQPKYNDEFGNNLWNSFILIPFQSFIKQIMFSFQNNNKDLDPREIYGNWIALNIMTSQNKLKNTNNYYILQGIQEINKLNYVEITKDLIIDGRQRILEKKYFKYALYYDDTKCQNKKCGKKYMKHKFGVDQLRMIRNPTENLINGSLKVMHKFYICKGCKMTFYCSKRCQKIDWNLFNHKLFCVRVRQTLS